MCGARVGDVEVEVLPRLLQVPHQAALRVLRCPPAVQLRGQVSALVRRGHQVVQRRHRRDARRRRKAIPLVRSELVRIATTPDAKVAGER